MPDLLEMNAVPVIYADGIGRVTVHGTMVRVALFEYRPVNGEMRKVSVVEVIRPMESFLPDVVRRLLMLAGDISEGAAAH